MQLLPGEELIQAQAGSYKLTTLRIAVGSDESFRSAWLTDVVMVEFSKRVPRGMYAWAAVLFAGGLLLLSNSDSFMTGWVARMQGVGIILALAGVLQFIWALINTRSQISFCTAAGPLLLRFGWLSESDVAGIYNACQQMRNQARIGSPVSA